MVHVLLVNIGPSVKLGSELNLVSRLCRELVFDRSLGLEFRRRRDVRNIVYVEIELSEVGIWTCDVFGSGILELEPRLPRCRAPRTRSCAANAVEAQPRHRERGCAPRTR